MKVVLDTNIFLSGLIFPKSKPSLILSLARKREFETYCSIFIIREIKLVLADKFGFDEKTINQFAEELLQFVIVIDPHKKVNIISAKKDDNRILECALSAKADYLITGDKKHILPLRKIGTIKTINASDFIEELDK
jgi:putative PIN family toxin of toxin-antitoxin system